MQKKNIKLTVTIFTRFDWLQSSAQIPKSIKCLDSLFFYFNQKCGQQQQSTHIDDETYSDSPVATGL